ncbi:universal stress protein [Phenylobacterium deserti]|uniref:Universal stress protein n=1 Tax=Phenylobacterium deserti TaxID=1914756 RepID=A0A328AC25_9CAUL|nr:universal stress protein [Phenylobacterium deserti]RAK52292.1 universal stress protein [Phenylobacterium deserti]
MSWARILAPLSGGRGDAETIAAAAQLAEPFGAELACVYTPADIADVMPWMGEGFLGGVQTSALESLREAAAAGETRAREAMSGCAYDKARFIVLSTPVWAALSAESRLSDVVVFGSEAARGRGPLAEAFQQMLADEQRPVLVARDGFQPRGTIAVAWDGGKEASRAARLALPLLEKARDVVILAAPKASARSFDPARLQAYYAARGVNARLEVLKETGDAAPALLAAARGVSAEILVAGAFGHPRLQEFIFGGTTRTLLNSDQPSLFLSH